MLRWLVVLAALFMVTPAHARDTTGDLLTSCKTTVRVFESGTGFAENAYDIGHCTGFLTASRDFSQALSADRKGRICMPERVQTIQAIRVFVAWADAHPELHHQSSSLGVLSAFIAAFPCSSKP